MIMNTSNLIKIDYHEGMTMTEFISALQVENQLNITDLANRMNIARTTVANLKNKRPSDLVYYKLLQGFNGTYKQLYDMPLK